MGKYWCSASGMFISLSSIVCVFLPTFPAAERLSFCTEESRPSLSNDRQICWHLLSFVLFSLWAFTWKVLKRLFECYRNVDQGDLAPLTLEFFCAVCNWRGRFYQNKSWYQETHYRMYVSVCQIVNCLFVVFHSMFVYKEARKKVNSWQTELDFTYFVHILLLIYELLNVWGGS